MDTQLAHYANKLDYEIDAWDLKVALESRRKPRRDRRALIRCVRARAHPGAISLPHRTMSAETVTAIDREALVVTYCDGIGCNASTKGALNMTRLGFRVKELIGGLDWWKRDGHPTSQGEAAGVANECGCN